jgi:hypothetical protein
MSFTMVTNVQGPLTVQGPVNGVYRATLGPLPQNAGGAVTPVTAVITIRAEDAAGNVVQRAFNGPQVSRCI